MKKTCILLSILLSVLSVEAAQISYGGIDGRLTYSEKTEWGNLDAVFEKTGNNLLYTFSSVSLDGKEVNNTRSSNNIGGFYADGWWMGGNHNDGTPNAKTLSVEVSVDGKELTPGGSLDGKVLIIKVVNDIYFHDNAKFCTETITYSVSGNSIEVRGRHEYVHPRKITIDRYYPMQSVFMDETELLTPGGQCKIWTPLVIASEGHEIEFTKASAPNFCTFIEHSANGYQAVYLAREALGQRMLLDEDDMTFIGNSWGKSYHKVIGNHMVMAGDASLWHGVYSWFNTPVKDNCRVETDDLTFEYGAYINGEPRIMHLSPQGRMTQTAGIDDVVVGQEVFAQAGKGCIIVDSSSPATHCYTADGRLVHVGAGSFSCNPGVYLLKDMQGRSIKLAVR